MLNLIGVFLLLPTLAMPQQKRENAPTMEQCHADVKLWMFHDGQHDTKQDVTFSQLSDRMEEMANCESVDQPWFQLYSIVFTQTSAEYEQRLMRFIKRHGLMRKLMDEDAKGLGRK